MRPLNTYFDHTNLKANAKSADIIQLCNEAKEYGFYSVCVNGAYVPLAVEQLQDSDVKVTAVVGFPLGMMSTEAKVLETTQACQAGADEIDMVINVGALKDRKFDYVENEIAEIVKAAAEYGSIVKVIMEVCYLSPDEISKVGRLSVKAGAAYVKTSTGFGSSNGGPDVVDRIYKMMGSKIKVKAAGGIKDLKTAQKMINRGADRIGSSSSVAIMQEAAEAEAATEA